jgi:hypothetical protein
MEYTFFNLCLEVSQSAPFAHFLVHDGVGMNFDSGKHGCASGWHVGTGPPCDFKYG